MPLSILIAKLYGATFVVLGLGFLFNALYYKKLFGEILKNRTLIFLWGIITLVVGLLIVIHHNIWEANWTVLVTIIGWIALIKGLVSLLFPAAFNPMEKWFKNKGFIMFMGIMAIAFGALLGYFGFVA